MCKKARKEKRRKEKKGKAARERVSVFVMCLVNACSYHHKSRS